MKESKSPAKSLSQRELVRILEEQRGKYRIWTAAWRKRNPEKNRKIYMRYFKKKRDNGYVYKRRVGWVKKSEGAK